MLADILVVEVLKYMIIVSVLWSAYLVKSNDNIV